MADTNCTRCYGTGAVETGETHMGIPIVKFCPCQVARDVMDNLNDAWVGLSKAPRLESSPLSEYVYDDLLITATDETLRPHLRHVGIRMGWTWGFKVVTDVDLMTAWLSNAALMGKEILDPDAAAVSSLKASLVDLIEPPSLLVIRLGVKSARNSAMPEVLQEAILHRQTRQRPTWVVDQPTKRLTVGHLCFSEGVSDTLRRWDHLTLGDAIPPTPDVEMMGGFSYSPATNPSPLSLSFANPVPSLTLTPSSSPPPPMEGATRTVALPKAEPKKTKFKKKGDR